jgi:hypothetical protein
VEEVMSDEEEQEIKPQRHREHREEREKGAGNRGLLLWVKRKY